MAAPATLRNFRDSYVIENRPTKNFVSTARLKVDASTGARKRAFLYFGKPWPSGVTITQGKLRVWNAEAWAGSVTLTVERLSGSWAGSRVNWNNQPATAGTPVSLTKSGAAKSTMWEFDITAILQFVANGGAWYGLRISTNSTVVRNLYSAQSEASDYRPEISVQWSDAPEPPDGLQPAANNAVSVAKPTLSYIFTDVAGDTNMAFQHVQIDDATDFATPIYDSGMVPSTEPIFDLANPPAGAPAFAGLTNLQSVYWRVRVQDGSGATSQWSTDGNTAPAQFRRVDKTTLTSSALGSRVTATNVLTDPRNLSATWTGINTSGTNTSAGATTAYSAAIASAAGSTWTVAMRLRNTTAAPITVTGVGVGPTLAGAFGALAPMTANKSSTINPGQTVDVYHTSALPAGSDGFRARFTVPAGAAIGAIDMELTTVVSGTYAGELFDGSMVDTGVVGPSTYAWTGTANASTSTLTQLYVEDTSPTIPWALSAGRTQTKYRISISLASDPDRPLWDTGVVSGTTATMSAPPNTLKNKTDVYRLRIMVWDDIQRQKEGLNPIYYEWVRDFVYSPGTGVTAPTMTSVAIVEPYPFVDVTFTRSTPPDSFSIYRDNDLVENELLPGDLFVSGTTYQYRDTTPPPRQSHTWTVVANVNGVDSQPSAGATATPKPSFSWMMERDSTNPIALLKSGSEPAPVVDAQSRTMQEVHQPIGGSWPVLITQFISGFEGHVDAVLSDDVVSGLSARQMRNIFKKWKKTPGITLLLYMVDEVLEVVPYNMTYRPRAKGGGKVIYDVSFDFFEVNY